MKKLIFTLLTLLLYCSSFAQPFQSIFGKEKTEFGVWKPVTCYDPDPHQLGCGDTFVFETTPNDTISINGFVYQILSGYGCEYIREDTMTGKIYRYIPELEKEFLTCDMTLNVGDTFQLPLYDPFDEYFWSWYYSEQGSNVIVKQIDTIDGKKVIEFFGIPSNLYNHSLPSKGIFFKFIEGVGPIYGPLGYLGGSYGWEQYIGVLLCSHRDDSLFFMASELLGCCQFGAKIDDVESPMIKIYPNPANDLIRIEIMDNKMGEKLLILNSVGMVVYQENIQNNPLELNISHFSSGVYSVLYETSKEKVVSKFIKMK